jgi:deazaflavin-dependent oxidoreductase (nitroreductase family)
MGASTKYRIVHTLQNRMLNPPIRAALAAGFAPPGYVLLETIGRKSGQPRWTPVGNGLEGNTFWIVAEHGRRAGYVRNIETNPRVRIKLRHGWVTGTGHVLPGDDPLERQRRLGHRHPLRAMNAFVVRTLGTDLLTIRIDLD